MARQRYNESKPASCGPAPAPPAPPTPPEPYGGRCAVTAERPDCTCTGVHPPFGAPKNKVVLQQDFHYPPEEKAERAGLVHPVLLSVNTGASPPTAVLRNPQTGATASVAVGGALQWGFAVLQISSTTVVLEYRFDQWAELAYISLSSPAVTVRKPVGHLNKILQPVYNLQAIDPDFSCKQDVDPSDWLGKLAANISGGEEAILPAAGSLMAPNTDNGLFGNPEEYNKFTLTLQGQINSMPWGGKGPQPRGGRGYLTIWDVADYSQCTVLSEPHAFPERKLGMAGRHLRVVNQAVWGAHCGSEVMAVSPPAVAGATTSTALLRVTTVFDNSTAANTSYVEVVTDVNGTKLVATHNLGADGSAFYRAVLAQSERWDPFVARGAVSSLPSEDQRYTDMAQAILTQNMNLDQGFVPEYGAGQFWNTYNINFPLPPLSLVGALLEWNHAPEAMQYFSWFFSQNIDPETGKINYKNFGCDSDTDYGRLMDTFAQAVRYSGNTTFAASLLPSVHGMAQMMLSKHAAALAAYPVGHPLHGIVSGSPEHDICRDPGYFFSVNVWHIRGLDSLGKLHQEFPGISRNKTLEATLLPAANEWRENVRFAANFTAVRKADGSRDLYFLSPVVGSVYGLKESPLLPGGTESDCFNRTTCFASMSAGLVGGGSNSHTNYANFRIFSETLLAGVLDDEYELAIMNFREARRGTLLGMTRFRDVLDDMPILGYGKSSLRHDRLYSFHNTLTGHSMNYISRGTYSGSEQRQQLDYSVGAGTGIYGKKYRNWECGIGGEDCSLCVVSAIPSSYWVRWMLAMDNPDEDMVYLARGAPRRWYAAGGEPFGIKRAPTRFGLLSYTIQGPPADPTSCQQCEDAMALNGSITFAPHAYMTSSSPPSPAAAPPLISVKLRAPSRSPARCQVTVNSLRSSVTFLTWHAGNETAVFQLSSNAATTFSFKAVFKQ